MTRKPKSDRGAARQDEILRAAAVVFAEHGYERANIDKVCSAAGIARGTLYQYFADKQSLFREVLERFVARIRPTMQPFVPLGIPIPKDEKLIRGFLTLRLQGVFESLAEEPHVFRILVNEGTAKNAEVEDLVAAFDLELRAMIETELSYGAQTGLFVIDDVPFLANFIVGAVLKTAQAYLFRPETSMDPARLGEKTVQIVMRLIQPAPRQ
ncbi:MAG: TetR/AcrR family transcriptional regulator [Candidatus Schekmanbacteria bacterium]|nr:TetR/AcrR family transcriptional regulator [Candidatus Schekmanbacteria bacterium]